MRISILDLLVQMALHYAMLIFIIAVAIPLLPYLIASSFGMMGGGSGPNPVQHANGVAMTLSRMLLVLLRRIARWMWRVGRPWLWVRCMSWSRRITRRTSGFRVYIVAALLMGLILFVLYVALTTPFIHVDRARGVGGLRGISIAPPRPVTAEEIRDFVLSSVSKDQNANVVVSGKATRTVVDAAAQMLKPTWPNTKVAQDGQGLWIELRGNNKFGRVKTVMF